jgi:hypothetical protein
MTQPYLRVLLEHASFLKYCKNESLTTKGGRSAKIGSANRKPANLQT